MGRQKTILVVEDSPSQALTLRRLLEREGLQVLWAQDGRLGVMMAQQYDPEVIVLDVEMPDMNGFEACRTLKANEKTADIPLIMLSVHTESEMVQQGIDLGAVDFIPKDAFSDQVLLDTLRQLGVID